MATHKLVWFRNDLRTEDNHALYHACQNSAEAGVIAVVTITPTQWQMQDEAKCRVQFWLANLEKLKQDLAALNIPLKIIRAATNRELPEQLWALAQQLHVSDLYFNREYPEYEQTRDQQVEQLFFSHGAACHVSDSDLILPAGSVLNQ
jgi:deoxyribodipyrimidine photo-lyase